MNVKMFVFVVLCIASAGCVELENLCSSDHFSFKHGTEVNAFHRSTLNITFPSLSDYLIPHSFTCDPAGFANRSNFMSALKIKNAFNRKFAEFYTEDLINATAEELEQKRRTLSDNFWKPLSDLRSLEGRTDCLKAFVHKTYSGISVFYTLLRLMNDEGYPIHDDSNFKPSNSEAIEILRELLRTFKTGSGGQKCAFWADEGGDVYFHRKLVLQREFKFLTERSNPVGPDTKSMLIYDQLLPFYSPENTSDKGCVPVKELPPFYKQKGEHA